MTLESVSRVNVIIGRNNSGKSNVIEIVNRTFSETLISDRNTDIFPKVKIVFTNSFEELKSAFEENKGSKYSGSKFNRDDYDKLKIECIFEVGTDTSQKTWRMLWKTTNQHGYEVRGHGDSIRSDLEQKVSNAKMREMNGCPCLHIQADRMIVPEVKTQHGSPSKWVETIHSNGAELTDLLRHILHSKTDDADRYKNILIGRMNEILNPEIDIEEIRTISQNDSDTFEIYVREKGKSLYPLSTLGSGIKTTFQLIMMTEIIPEFHSKLTKSRLVFTLEELENNLHPAAQRRMYRYILNYAREHGSLFFISTHSSVCLNYFFRKEDASIYEVTQENGMSNIDLVSGPNGIRGVMDDIGANPSDIMQSNGVVWVEGPSDRIYIKKWLELAGFTDCEEGLDYQFQFYGGSILSHFSADDQTGKVGPFINMLMINRHSALVMDSDKTKEKDTVNQTKQRVLDEFRDAKLFTWCTDGKEIENYLKPADVEGAYPGWKNYRIKKYQPFSKFKKTSDSKVDFAIKVTEEMTDESLDQLDLREMINQLGETIRSWKEN